MKAEVVSRAHSARHEREIKKLRIKAAACIQSHYRSYCCRKLLFEKLSLKYGENVSQLGDKNTTLLHTVTRQLLFMSTVKLEVDKVISLCQHWIKMKHEIIRSQDESVCLVQLKRLLEICCRILQNSLYNSRSYTIPLRMIEVFTDPKIVTVKSLNNVLLEHLSKHGIFTSLVSVFEELVPVPKGCSTHQHPLATSLLQIITTLIGRGNESMLQAFVSTAMKHKLTAYMAYYIIPAMKKVVTVSAIISAIKTTRSFSLDALYCLMDIIKGRIAVMDPPNLIQLVDTIGLLLEGCGSDHKPSYDIDQLLYESHTLYDKVDPLDSQEALQSCCLCKVSSRELAIAIMKIIDHSDIIKPLSKLCYELLKRPYPYHSSCLFQLLSLQSDILKYLWTSVTSMHSVGKMGSTKINVIKQLIGGLELSRTNSHDLISQLVTFCSVFQVTLLALHDAEFFNDITGKVPLPFNLSEICSMSTVLCDITVSMTLGKHLPNTLIHEPSKSDTVAPPSIAEWNCLLTHLQRLLRLLHERDSRRSFCPKDHWVADLPYHKLDQLPLNTFEEEDESQTTRPLRQPLIQTRELLKHTPFVYSFTDRVKLFWKLVNRDKLMVQGPPIFALIGKEPHVSLLVRREKLYNDAYVQLAQHDADIRKNLRVTMFNLLMLEEAGIGKGVTREFLCELIKESFDPDKGLFRSSDNKELFPNPQAHMIMKDYPQHYHFIGRLLGKALYENMLVELPLAGFFLCKIIGGGSVDIHHLATLDPQMYRSLMSLKETSVIDLYLDFSISNNDMGELQTIDLKPLGSDIPVTDENKFEYIHLVANYKLNRELSRQCASFREGLASVIPEKWFQLFNHDELQELMSGEDVAVDMTDLRAHTKYSGDYYDGHETIKIFWKVVSAMTNEQKQLLLKFVTCCTRAPLFGFKNLFPPFGIQSVCGEEEEDKLPTAATCMNLLKLPDYKDETQMKEKLLYAIECAAGLELT